MSGLFYYRFIFLYQYRVRAALSKRVWGVPQFRGAETAGESVTTAAEKTRFFCQGVPCPLGGFFGHLSFHKERCKQNGSILFLLPRMKNH